MAEEKTPDEQKSGNGEQASGGASGSFARLPVQLLDDKLRLVALIIGVMLIAGGGITALAFAWPAIDLVVRTLLPFVVGFVFAYIFNPVVTFVQERLKLSRVGGVLFLYLMLILALMGFVAMVLPILITQVRGAYLGLSHFIGEQLQRSPELQDLWDRASEWLAERELTVEALVMQAFQTTEIRDAARTAAASGFVIVGQTLSFIYSIGAWIFGTTFFFVFAILVNIYLLIDFARIRNVMEVMVPASKHKRTFEVMGKVDIAVGGYIRGILIVAFLVGSMTFAALWALGLREYALLIGIVAGVANLVPYLGPIVGATPAVLYVLFSAQYEGMQERLGTLALVVIAMSIIQMIESYLFQPKIVGKSAQLHPLAVLLAFAFGANFGILGIIVCVPIACIVRVLIKEFYWDRREHAWNRRLKAEKRRQRIRRQHRAPAKT